MTDWCHNTLRLRADKKVIKKLFAKNGLMPGGELSFERILPIKTSPINNVYAKFAILMDKDGALDIEKVLGKKILVWGSKWDLPEGPERTYDKVLSVDKKTDEIVWDFSSASGSPFAVIEALAAKTPDCQWLFTGSQDSLTMVGFREGKKVFERDLWSSSFSVYATHRDIGDEWVHPDERNYQQLANICGELVTYNDYEGISDQCDHFQEVVAHITTDDWRAMSPRQAATIIMTGMSIDVAAKAMANEPVIGDTILESWITATGIAVDPNSLYTLLNGVVFNPETDAESIVDNLVMIGEKEKQKVADTIPSNNFSL